MKNIITTLLFCFVFFICFNISHATTNKRTYINGFDTDFPPFSYLNENGKPEGFDIAAINWIAKEMDFKIVHQPAVWDAIVSSLHTKDIDIISGGMSITPNRQQLVTFSNPYWQMRKVYLVREDSTLDANTIQNTKIRLGVQRGTNDADMAQNNIHTKNYRYSLRFYKSASLAINDLALGRIQAVAIDNFPAEDAIAKGKPIKIVGELGVVDNIGVAMRHEDKKLHAIINEGYKRLRADPYWKELQKIYLRKE